MPSTPDLATYVASVRQTTEPTSLPLVRCKGPPDTGIIAYVHVHVYESINL